jgi:hypothetical protein
LIHECMECKALSINRIAADDDAEAVLAVFQESFELDLRTRSVCQQYGISVLNTEDTRTVYIQLYGHAVAIPATR